MKENELKNGLIQGHAYSVTKVNLLPVRKEFGEGKSCQMIRLRNPWGNQNEWNGEFCDGHPSWNKYFTDETIKSLGHTYQADGEFWMQLEDFMENFERVEVCHLIPEMEIPGTTRTKYWTAHGFHGKWTKDVTAGGPLHQGQKVLRVRS